MDIVSSAAETPQAVEDVLPITLHEVKKKKKKKETVSPYSDLIQDKNRKKKENVENGKRQGGKTLVVYMPLPLLIDVAIVGNQPRAGIEGLLG